MSYDLFVWSEPSVDEPDEAFELIEAISEGNPDRLRPSPRIDAFLADLFAEYPRLDASNDRDAPWSCSDDISDRHALLSLQDASHSACRRVLSLSKKHGLNCFDPQSGELVVTA